MANIFFQRCNKNAKTPTRGTEYSAGWDLYTCEEVTLEPGQAKLVGTGLKIEIPTGLFGAIYPRSGMATKQGIVLKNLTGIIDSDYRGEVGLPLWNTSNGVVSISAGTRVAQIIFQPYAMIGGFIEDVITDTERGEGGFGHTGTN